MFCDHCKTRIGGAMGGGSDPTPFRYGDWSFCCECMSQLCSWFLDGGITADPELFAYLPHHPEEADDAAV
jgi:hypothetical protein